MFDDEDNKKSQCRPPSPILSYSKHLTNKAHLKYKNESSGIKWNAVADEISSTDVEDSKAKSNDTNRNKNSFFQSKSNETFHSISERALYKDPTMTTSDTFADHYTNNDNAKSLNFKTSWKASKNDDSSHLDSSSWTKLSESSSHCSQKLKERRGLDFLGPGEPKRSKTVNPSVFSFSGTNRYNGVEVSSPKKASTTKNDSCSSSKGQTFDELCWKKKLKKQVKHVFLHFRYIMYS